MRLALSLLLALASCTLLWGTPLPPQDVRLEAQNFHVFLHWDPDLSLPDSATYEVEWKRWRTPRWTRAEGCWEDSTNSSWGCKLHFDKIHDIYWARVRVVAGGKVSNWTHSSPLQPYRDTIVGPPKLYCLLQDDVLSVQVIMSLTPFRKKNGSYKPVNQVLRKLWYLLSLYEEDVLVQQIPCKQSSEDAPCTFKHLKPSMQYCVRTVAMGMAREQSREAEQCMETPAAPPGFSRVLLVVLIGIFLPLSVIGLCFVQLHIFSSPRETQLPEALAVLSRELTVPARAPTLELTKEDALTLHLATIIPSCGSSVAEQTTSMVPLLLSKSLSQDTSAYCANGFGQDCHEDRDPSCTHSLFGSWASSRLEEAGEVCLGDDVLEQPMLVGLTRDSYTRDRDYQISKVWFPPHLQLYTKCQCSAQRAGSCLSLFASGRSFSHGDLQDSLGVAGHRVALSSVKLPASEEEDDEEQLVPGVQHTCGTEPQPGDNTVQQNSLELVAPGTPCQLPQLPPNILQSFAFSGYELCPQADGEP